MAEWSKAVDSSSILFGGVGSNPTGCITLIAWMAEGSKAVDLSSILFGGVGSNPTPSMLFFFALTHLILNDYIIAPLAQTVER